MPWDSCLFQNDVATLNCVPFIFTNVVKGLIILSGTVAIIMIIYSGIRFITSGGDQKTISSARQTLVYAVIGLIVVILSFAIIYFIGYLTNSTSCLESLGRTSGNFIGGCQ